MATTESTADDGALVILREVVVGYGGRGILPPVSLTVRREESWALVGRNGSGKSTLLRTMLGLLPRVTGDVERRPGLPISYVPQRGDFDLRVPARVVDFVTGGVDRGWGFAAPGRVRRARPAIEAAMADAEVTDLARQRFAELSEGQKQRVLVARALASSPAMLVLDEPTSAMDPVAEQAVFALLDRLRRRRRLAVVMASHQMTFVPRFATHVAFVDRHHDFVLAGPTAEVIAHEHFRTHYGTLAPPTPAPDGDVDREVALE